MNEEKSFTGLYFGVLPDFRELVAYLVEEQSEGLSTIQPIGCRELLFTEQRIVLSPCLESGRQAFIVCKKSVLKCGKFQDLMNKLKFQIVKEVEVNKELFRYCFTFTLTQKLAPLWNKIEEYFVQGRDFLEGTTKLNVISIEVNITDRLCIGLKAFNIKLKLSSADNFCSSSNILQSFLAQRHFTVKQDSIQNDLCYVLPSLKKARVVGISHDIPTDSPFQCYEDLRRHWKLMYGYRLPSTQAIFYNVRFCSFSKGKVFTYPSSCIHSNYPQIFPRCDQEAIFQSFLQDIQMRVSCVCESPLTLTSSALYPSNKLYSAANGQQSSLTRVPPQIKHCTPYVFSHIEHRQASSHNTGMSGSDSNDAMHSVAKGAGPRLIPNFSKRTQSSHGKAQSEHKTSTRDLSFIPKVQSNFKTKPTLSKDISSCSQGFDRDRALPQQRKRLILSTSFTSHNKKLPDTRPGLTLARSVCKSTHPSVLCTTNNVNKPERVLMNTCDDSATTTHSLVLMKNPVQQSGGVQPMETTYRNERLSSLCSNGTPNKRQQNSIMDVNGTQIKKPRLKPKVQNDIDVRQLALDNQLKKVNTITLIDWLKKHNVTVKQKEKKVELMEKVMNVIRSNES